MDLLSALTLTNLFAFASQLLTLFMFYWAIKIYFSSLGFVIDVKRKPLIALLVLSFLWNLFFTLFPGQGVAPIAALSVLFVCVALSFVIASGNRFLILLAALSLYMMLLTSEGLMRLAIDLMGLDFTNPNIFAVSSIIRMVIIVLGILAIRRIISAKQQNESQIDLMSTIPLFINLLSSALITHYVLNLTLSGRIDDMSGALILTALLIAILTITTLFFVLNKQFAMQQENAIYNHQIEFYDSLLKEKEHEYLHSKTLKHDQRQHLIYLLSTLEEDRNEDAISYLKDMLGETSLSNEYKSGNKVIDSLLNYRQPWLEQDKIKLESSIKVPAHININDIDLCIILGNLLDNAIEATAKVTSEDRVIKLSIRYEDGGNLFILISNPYNEELKQGGLGGILSTKANTELHGLGLYSIRRSLEKYDGKLITKPDGQQFEAIALVYGNGDEE